MWVTGFTLLVSTTAEPGFVFRQWEDVAGGGVPNSRSRDI